MSALGGKADVNGQPRQRPLLTHFGRGLRGAADAPECRGAVA
jgi:hypothetical protein